MGKTTTTSSRPERGESLHSLRLKALAAHYSNQHSVWDIGCDHGLLGLSFMSDPSVEAIHLVDPSLPVIENLNKTIDAYITKETFSKLTLHHQMGQEVILNPESKCIFIAGMGGKEIEKIIPKLMKQMNDEDSLIISPHRNIVELRFFLHSENIFCQKESLVEEDGRIYQLIHLTLNSKCPHVSLYGDALWKTPLGAKYREHQLKHFSRHKDPHSVGYRAFLQTL